MEVPGGSNNKRRVLICEMLGTALFVYGILVSRGNAIAVPLSLFASLVIFGGISGGHFNPAVTLGVWIARGKLFSDLVFMIGIILFQCVGAILAIGLSYLSLFGKFNGEYKVKTPAYACPVDMTTDGKECDNTDGDGFHYNF